MIAHNQTKARPLGDGRGHSKASCVATLHNSINNAARFAKQGRRRIDFDKVNRVALDNLPAVLARILPGGKRTGREWTCLNPTRADKHLGSFRVNSHTCRWGDFATGVRGGDPVSLVAYLENCSQTEAANRLARMLGINVQVR
jgi:hypothetical protein